MRDRPKTTTKANLLPVYDALGRLESVRDANHTIGTDTLSALMKYAPDGTILALNRGVYSSQNLENDYIYEQENHRLQKVSGNSMNLIGGRITDGTLGYQGKVNFSYDEVGRMTSDASKGMYLEWRNDDDQISSVIVAGVDGWDRTPVNLNFGYKGGSRIAKFSNSFESQNHLKTYESRYYLLGGKEIRVGENGKIRSILYPDFGGSSRKTITYNSDFSELTQKNEFYAKDYLGSTARVFDVANGIANLKLVSEFDAWGREIQSIETATEEIDDRFTGKRQDKEMGTRDHGARSMDMDLPVWLSPDALRQFSNLYEYDGDPINHLDKTGYESTKIPIRYETKADLTYEMNYFKNTVYDLPMGIPIVAHVIESRLDTKYYNDNNPVMWDVEGMGMFKWNEVNYLGIGMMEAARGNTLQNAVDNTTLWKKRYGDTPSEGTLEWLKIGFDFYNGIDDINKKCSDMPFRNQSSAPADASSVEVN